MHVNSWTTSSTGIDSVHEMFHEMTPKRLRNNLNVNCIVDVIFEDYVVSI